MCDTETTKHTVTTNEEFIEELCATYPSTNTVSQALLCAAQDGVDFRQAIEGDLEEYVYQLVDDRLEGTGGSVARADD